MTLTPAISLYRMKAIKLAAIFCLWPLLLAGGHLSIMPTGSRADSWEFNSELKNYAVLAPSAFHPGRPFSVAVNLLTPDVGLSRADASLACTPGLVGYVAFTLSAAWSATAGKLQRSAVLTMELDSPPKNLDFSAQCKLTVRLSDTSGRDFSGTENVSVRPVRTETFVQTDKAIYRPGQAVKFRVATVSESLKPLFQNVTVFVKDAEGNLVDKFEHRPRPGTTDIADAVLTAQFQLSDQPNLGDWSLVAETEVGKETKVFTVDRYVLPKLELRLELPDFVHTNDTEFRVTAEPRYTYDKTADGDLTVKATVLHRCLRIGDLYRDVNCNFTLTGRPVKAPGHEAGAKKLTLTFALQDWREQLASKGLMQSQWSPASVLVAAEFSEKFSGVKTQVNKTFKIYKDLFRMEIDTSAVDFVLPGMAVPLKLKLIRADAKPYLGQLPDGNVTLRMTWHVRGVSISKLVYSGRPPPAADSGNTAVWTVPVLVPEKADFTGISFEASCPGLSSMFYASLRSFETRGLSAVRVEAAAVSGDGKEASGLAVTVFRGDGILASSVFCAIVNQEGVLIEWLPLSPVAGVASASSATLSADRVAELAPRFTLLGVGFHGNEMVAAALTYQPAGTYDGVRLTSNVTGPASPQQPVSISVTAAAESLVFLTGIDHSVNLMKSGQDISAQTVEDRVAAAAAAKNQAGDQARFPWWRPAPSTASELQKAGLLAITDFNYLKEERRVYFSDANMRFNDGIEMAAAAPMGAAPMAKANSAPEMAVKPPSAATGGSKPATVRKFFPESFVWTWVRTDSSGTANHTVTLPDTITSWDVTGFALNAVRPLQAARAPLNIVSRREFFLRAVLPYALVRGEKFLLKVLLFNYGQATRSVVVRLGDGGGSFRLLGDVAEGGDVNSRKAAVPAGGSALVAFAVEPIQLPEMRLSLRAESASPDALLLDAVERQVRVEAEGATQRRVASALLNLTALAGLPHAAAQLLKVEFPPASEWLDGKQLVEGSEYARVQVTGTILGASVANLERLLRMPYGCGEQNMINFAPAVFVLDCLGPTEATPDVLARAVTIMKTGYQRELTYRRTDGSYSAFGNSDRSGSTWLTAFVLSVYAQAASFITIDPEALSGQSLAFLLSQQRADGSFAEPGRVIHADMQGAGASGPAGLTAYVSAALVRIVKACHVRADLRSRVWLSGRLAADTAAALARALAFVHADYRARPADFRPADLAVAAYAARLAVLEAPGSSAKVANFLWMQLYEASVSDGDSADRRYWPGSAAETSSAASGRPAGSVETTGYALMTAMMRDDLEAALPALRWLSSRQGDLGGFESTQDTVVGLQAMGLFAKAHPGGDGVGGVTVSWPGQSAPLQFGLGPSNRTLLQRREAGRGAAARALASGVSVRGQGSGVAVVTVAYAYNLRDAPHGWLGAEWTRRAGVALRLGDGDGRTRLGGFAPEGSVEFAVCAQASNGPGMYILALTNPSGFAVDAHTPVGGAVARVEPEPDRLVFYLSELTDTEVCLAARWMREVPVLDLNPQRITVQNYYKPDQEISLFHLHPGLRGLTECKVCPDCPRCARPTNNEL